MSHANTLNASQLKQVWAGMAFSNSGDLFVVGAHNLTGKIYCLGDDPSNIRNATINIDGYKLGLGLGGSGGLAFVIAYGYNSASELAGDSGGWDFDLAIAVKLGDFLKDIRVLG